MGKVCVDVLFGTKENCRTDNIQFEVVDLECPYHALLRSPTLAKFMISTNVAYLKMKMPGPNGVITISGNYKRSMECASAGSCSAKSLIIAAEKRKINEVVALAQSAQLGMSGMPGMAHLKQSRAFQVPKETKRINIDPAFPEHNVIIGTGSTNK